MQACRHVANREASVGVGRVGLAGRQVCERASGQAHLHVCMRAHMLACVCHVCALGGVWVGGQSDVPANM